MSEEMTDSEMWKLYKERSREKRASNREESTKILKQARINFISKNGGAHLVIARRGVVVDFWPGTGKWNCRSGKNGRGVRNLIKYMDKQQKV